MCVDFQMKNSDVPGGSGEKARAHDFIVSRHCGQRRYPSGFSLGEMLAAVIISAMMLTAILSIYGRANRAAEAVLSKVESPSLASEVLQLIAEDLGRTLGADDMTVRIRNGFDNGFVRAELVLRRTYHDHENKEQTLEEIFWRAGYDRGGPTPGLVIYRSYNGVGQEDKLLDDQREIWEKNYPFVPICRGVTFFQIQAYQGEDLVDQWPPSAPPPGIKVTISFAEPYETVRGTWDVRDDQKISRTLAIDPTRQVKFALDLPADANAVDDPNAQPTDGAAPDNQPPGGRTMNRQSPGTRAPNAQTRTRTRPR